MAPLTSQRRLSPAVAVLGLVVGVAGLKLARGLLVPLGLAGVACLFLAPLVHLLERQAIPRAHERSAGERRRFITSRERVAMTAGAHLLVGGLPAIGLFGGVHTIPGRTIARDGWCPWCSNASGTTGECGNHHQRDKHD